MDKPIVTLTRWTRLRYFGGVLLQGVVGEGHRIAEAGRHITTSFVQGVARRCDEDGVEETLVETCNTLYRLDPEPADWAVFDAA